MRFSHLALAALPLATQAFDLFDDNSFVEQEGFLRFPISVAKGAVSKHLKRQTNVGLANRQTGFFYTIELKMGSPGRAVSVSFDTGSSELWVNPNCAKASDQAYCETFGKFGDSSSFVDMHQNNTLAYGRGSAEVEYGYDYVTVGSAKINQQVFGVATDSEFHTTGLLGAGPSLDGWKSPYPYVIDNLFTQKFTKSRAFSLDLRNIGSARGAVVFGGIDTKKFSGPLAKRPIIPAAQSPDGKTRYWIYLDGITINKDDGTKVTVFDQPNGQPVLLDSGYTVSALPTKHFNAILKAFPSAKLEEGTGQYTVDCSVAKSTKGSINYKFGDVTIKVPYADFIWQQPANDVCVLGVIEDNEFPVLGDTFLRAAYVVFDWDNEVIHLGNNEDCGTNLIAIGSGPLAIPSLIGDCGKPATKTSSATTAASTTTSIANTSAGNNTVTATSAHTGNSTAPTSTSSHVFTTGWSNSTATKTTLTSTFKTTHVYTVTSCAPTVTNCPVGHVTTDIITSYTTFCPGETEAPQPTTSKYVKPPCPETTVTVVLPKTIYCKPGMSGCNPGETVTTSNPVTVVPITPVPKPTPIPGCNNCQAAPPSTDALPTTPAAPVVVMPVEPVQSTENPVLPPTETVPATTVVPTTLGTIVPSGGPIATQSQPPTAGAAGLFVPGTAAMIVGAAVAALL